MERKGHWEEVYSSKQPTEVSWFQSRPEISLALIEEIPLAPGSAVIDIGGGASRLVDHRLDAGLERPAVLDIAAAGLRHSQQRLGARAEDVDWYETDVTRFDPPRTFALWHDRAVFHFLTHAPDRERYISVLRKAVVPGGHVIIACFAPDGPAKCSGLDVRRYGPEAMTAELGVGFQLRKMQSEEHLTPAGDMQRFNYFLFQLE